MTIPEFKAIWHAGTFQLWVYSKEEHLRLWQMQRHLSRTIQVLSGLPARKSMAVMLNAMLHCEATLDTGKKVKLDEDIPIPPYHCAIIGAFY